MGNSIYWCTSFHRFGLPIAISHRLLYGFLIPIAQNDRAGPVFHFCHSNPFEKFLLELEVDFTDWGGGGAHPPTPLLNVCGGPL